MIRKKNPPTASLVVPSAAEYLTFVAASGGGVEAGNLAEEAVIRDFRITASGSETYDTQHEDLSAIAGIGPRIGPGWPDSPGHRACSRKEAAA